LTVSGRPQSLRSPVMDATEARRLFWVAVRVISRGVDLYWNHQFQVDRHLNGSSLWSALWQASRAPAVVAADRGVVPSDPARAVTSRVRPSAPVSRTRSSSSPESVMALAAMP